MVKLIVGGDFCPYRGNLKESAFHVISDIYDGADLGIVNFECALCDKNDSPIMKEGPSLQCSVEQFRQVEQIHTKLVTLANNHTLDYGPHGLERLFNACQSLGIDYIGAGINGQEAKKVYYYKKIAIINCCEEEFSIAKSDVPGANSINSISIYYQIQEARKNANCVIIVVHGGIEYYQLPSPQTQDLYRFFIDAGASAVIGHHPHCFSGYEQYHHGFIYYSLGNLFFYNNSREHTMWNDGFLLELNITEDGLIKERQIIPYVQCCGEIGIRLLAEMEKEPFWREMDNLNRIINDRDALEKRYRQFCLSHKRNSLSRILPYSNKILLGLYKRGLFPSFLSSKAIVARLNAMRCESHRHILIENLETLYKNL